MDLTWHMVSKPVIWISLTGIGTTACQYFRKQHDQGVGRHSLQIANQGQRRHNLMMLLAIE